MKAFLNSFFQLIRVSQWYKNLVAFVPLMFSGSFFDADLIALSLLGFIALCLVSSASYAINDVIDAGSDRKHPVKKKRPVASGRIPVAAALAIALLLLVLFGAVAFYLGNAAFFAVCAALFASNVAYSFYFKHRAVIDIFVISTNFVLRALAGNIVVPLEISPWLLLIVFLLALFLALGKRKAEMKTLGSKAGEHRRTNNFYTQEMLSSMILVTLTMILVFYSIYTLFVKSQELMITIPFAIFLVFRYLYFINRNDVIATRTELVFKDKQMLAGMLAWLVLSLFVLYVMK